MAPKKQPILKGKPAKDKTKNSLTIAQNQDNPNKDVKTLNKNLIGNYMNSILSIKIKKRASKKKRRLKQPKEIKKIKIAFPVLGNWLVPFKTNKAYAQIHSNPNKRFFKVINFLINCYFITLQLSIIYNGINKVYLRSVMIISEFLFTPDLASIYQNFRWIYQKR